MTSINPQDDPQWRIDRCGSVGGSSLADVLRKIKSGGYSASRASLMARLACERFTGVPTATFTSKAMQEGKDREPIAASTYEFMTNQTIVLVGVVPHPWIAGAHASPDGLVGDEGLIEMKNPEHAAHMATLLGNGAIDPDYVWQMQWEMACTGRAWCDYVSFHPDFPESMQLYIQRVPRNNEMIEFAEREVEKFVAELDAKIVALTARFGGRPNSQLLEQLRQSAAA